MEDSSTLPCRNNEERYRHRRRRRESSSLDLLAAEIPLKWLLLLLIPPLLVGTDAPNDRAAFLLPSFGPNASVQRKPPPSSFPPAPGMPTFSPFPSSSDAGRKSNLLLRGRRGSMAGGRRKGGSEEDRGSVPNFYSFFTAVGRNRPRREGALAISLSPSWVSPSLSLFNGHHTARFYVLNVLTSRSSLSPTLFQVFQPRDAASLPSRQIPHPPFLWQGERATFKDLASLSPHSF